MPKKYEYPELEKPNPLGAASELERDTATLAVFNYLILSTLLTAQVASHERGSSKRIKGEEVLEKTTELCDPICAKYLAALDKL